MAQVSSSFIHREQVRWADLDAMGVLNNAVYATLLEQARLAYFAREGWLRGAAFPFVLGESRIRFHRPVTEPGEVQVVARVSRLGVKSFDMVYEVRRGDTLHASAEAALVWVGPDLASAPIPAAVRARLAALEGLSGDPGGERGPR